METDMGIDTINKSAPCGTRFVNLAGETFGKITIISYEGKDHKGNTYWNCVCSCGNKMTIRGECVKSGRTVSCGKGKCSPKHKEPENRKATGKTSPHNYTYRSWNSMMKRCYSRNSNRFHSHGGRGIVVCDRWHTFSNFVEDMGERPQGLSIDRINNNGNYEPGNCRWATPKEQARNTRRSIMIEYDGQTKSLPEWCEILGLNYKSILARVENGWNHKEALTTPVSKNCSRGVGKHR